MYDTWDVNQRISEAKRLTERLVDHAHYLLDIRENNAIVVYSDRLSKQIPRSYAANAFNVLREAMHQIEMVRLSALWDQAHVDNEAIMTVVELIDDDKVIAALAENARARYISLPEPADGKKSNEATLELLKEANRIRGEEHAANAAQGLRGAIAAARKIKSSAGLKSLKNLRDKHIAHYLTQSSAERRGDAIPPMKVGDERPILDGSLAIIQLLYSWVNGIAVSFAESRKIDQKCAEELWNCCKFEIIDKSKEASKAST
ncbi:hypothetical protein XI07_14990 [Bradyrhizobium sp. CCBAU 11445]|uniref:AbiU2 domain-containing protein n=1 Tax=unclassified Bradyrhizobium TaxID=2631580 RepID=UPI002306B5C2|nr:MULTISPECIES: hypothetical protein [unclassified Bradyrhizobium]MDA9453543.1 hypothetical protein [Bradyrhizobium sp. CCBAU 21359]MDA9483304.1 hypothetical protein [Bradyrhizobium sp. CCBAU 11445]MDA9519053.1 hypothetical protein [Bradyrhizobium sp. CCBAU 11434]